MMELLDVHSFNCIGYLLQFVQDGIYQTHPLMFIRTYETSLIDNTINLRYNLRIMNNEICNFVTFTAYVGNF